jgi:hypothetical protein
MAKRTTKKKVAPKGLGDTVEQITEATGIKKAVKWIFGEDCGCEDRKNWLNEKFPYNQKLTEAEFDYLDTYFLSKKEIVTKEQQKELISIFNRLFNQKAQASSCAPCFKKRIHDELAALYAAYKVS